VILGFISYSCKGVEDEVLDNIRADIGKREVFFIPYGQIELEYLKSSRRHSVRRPYSATSKWSC
jgi:hypothetical protein